MGDNVTIRILENKIRFVMSMLTERKIKTTIILESNTIVVNGRMLIRGTKSELYKHLDTMVTTLWLVPIPERDQNNGA